MNKEINSILNRLKDLFFELEKQIKFEENNKHKIDNKKLSKYEKDYINNQLNLIYTEELDLINSINELIDRFNFLVDDNELYYIDSFDLSKFNKKDIDKALLNIEKYRKDNI